jgi:phenylacetate-CoA ligase
VQNKFGSGIYLSKYDFFKPGARKGFEEVIAFQNLSKEEQEYLSWKKVEALLEHAYKNVPWYSRNFKKIGLSPKDISQPQYFNQVPVITREDLKGNFNEFISDTHRGRKIKIITTGGSTGVPLKIGVNPKAVRELQKWQMFSWWGLSPEVDMASIYREIPIGTLTKLVLKFINWPRKVTSLNATNLSENSIKAFLKEFEKNKPEVLHGYLGALDTLADYILDRQISLPSPKVIWSTAAPLAKVQQRKIQKAFGAPVCDQYGCSEMYFIAASCPENNGLHQFSDAIKLEVLDGKGSQVSIGDKGKITLTNLNELAFPLIRYENGDQGRWLKSSCNCGINLPLMDQVKGRKSDNFNLPDGSVISGEYLTTLFDDYPDAVKRFQVVQNKDLSIDLNVSTNGQQDKVLRQVKQGLEEKVKYQVAVVLVVTDEIQSFGGKLRYVIKN